MKKTVGLLIGLLHSAFSYEFSEQDRPLQLIFEKTLSNPDWVTFDPIDGRKQLYDAALASLNLTVDDTKSWSLRSMKFPESCGLYQYLLNLIEEIPQNLRDELDLGEWSLPELRNNYQKITQQTDHYINSVTSWSLQRRLTGIDFPPPSHPLQNSLPLLQQRLLDLSLLPTTDTTQQTPPPPHLELAMNFYDTLVEQTHDLILALHLRNQRFGTFESLPTWGQKFLLHEIPMFLISYALDRLFNAFQNPNRYEQKSIKDTVPYTTQTLSMATDLYYQMQKKQSES